MKQLERKDVILIVILAFSALFLAVSRPDDIDAKMVVWDYGFIMLVTASVLWTGGEILDWFLRQINGNTRNEHIGTLSRDGMLVLAESHGLGGKAELGSLSDVDLLALVMAKSNSSGGAVSSKDISIREILVFSVKFWKGVVAKVIGLFKSKNKSDDIESVITKPLSRNVRKRLK
jgi:hypothetical protein